MTSQADVSIVSRSRFALALLIVLHILPFAGRPGFIGGDEPHYSLAAVSMAVDRDLNLLPDYEKVAVEASRAAGSRIAGSELEHHLVNHKGKLVFSHPIGLPLLLAPVLYIQQAVYPGAGPDILVGLLTLILTFLALLAGRDLVFLVVGDHREADFLTFGLYFSTPLWFYSRTFFTEPYLWSFFVISIWCMSRNYYFLASLPLGYSFLIKETAVLFLLPVLIAVWYRKGGRTGLKTSFFPALILGVFVAKNLKLYGEPFVTFQPFQYGNVMTGIPGLLFDISHGLLIFAPLTLVLLCFRFKGMLDSRLRVEFIVAIVVFSSWFLLTACWIDWKGGSCYGPRLLVPVLPAAGLLILGAWIQRLRRSSFLRGAVASLVVIGFAVQWCAAVDPFKAFWSLPVHELLLDDPLMTFLGMVIGVLILRSLRAPKPPQVVNQTN